MLRRIQTMSESDQALLRVILDVHGMPAPDADWYSRDTVFWFKPAGWRRYGRTVATELVDRDVPFVILQHRHPRRSHIVEYEDEWQIAMRPVGG